MADLTVTAEIAAAARKGLVLHDAGKSGDGLVPATVRDARRMADREALSEAKVRRMPGWFARHATDRTPNWDKPGEETPGYVAWLLWGGDSAADWAERKVEELDREQADRSASTLVLDDAEFCTEHGVGIGSIHVVDSKFEHRYVDVSDIEVRDGANGDGMSFRGYAAKFNVWSENLGGFRERIAPGAFARSLKSRNEIRMYLNHNTDMVLASRRAGTLRLSEDERGLAVEADLPDTTYGRDLSVLMQRGDVNSMSFGFSVPPKGDAWNTAGTERELREVRLAEVSAVTGQPAYPQTEAQVRSLDVLAEKTGLDAVRMNEAITKLEQGEELSADDAALLDEAIAKLKPAVVEEPEAVDASALLLKKKRIDLLYLAA